METKRAMDGFGAASLVGFALLLAFNQVVVKVTGGGFGPVFQAGLRSLGGIFILLLWIRYRGIPISIVPGATLWGVVSGGLFAVEFMALFQALDQSTVSRVSIIFYSMPVWLAIAGHVLLPGERMSRIKLVGLLLAMSGVVVALFDRSAPGASLTGDLLALFAAMCWAAIALTVRVTPLSQVRPEVQLLFQVVVSAVILLALAPLVGDMLRDLTLLHLAGLAFQIIGVAFFGFLLWFWLMTIYPASSVASFSFLTPVLAVFLGWLLLDEVVGIEIWGALVLVAAGIFLINRK
jgi:drug/metabolite transporter (DMT)-like permease